MTLAIGIANDPNDHIALMPSGNVGIGMVNPSARLEVNGDVKVNGALNVNGSLQVKGKIQGHILVEDTRKKNPLPKEYGREVAFEFKESKVLNVPGGSTYSATMTLAPWLKDLTGGNHHQLGFNNSGLFWRQGKPDSETWDNWNQLATSGMTDNFKFMGSVGIGNWTISSEGKEGINLIFKYNNQKVAFFSADGDPFQIYEKKDGK